MQSRLSSRRVCRVKPTGGKRVWWWRAAVTVVLALAALACTTVPNASFGSAVQAEPLVTEQQPRAAPEDIVRLVVESRGGVYAGDCAATRSPEDVGKICSKLIAERSGLRAYLVGRTFSEFSTWVFVEQTPAGWQPAGTAPLDFFATQIAIPWPR